ncbi:MAG: hypothetical protein J0H75_16970, partial [Rhizobiales bacterium]|nr:hypothetical protein [Hyphomicrobiales bacterium]
MGLHAAAALDVDIHRAAVAGAGCQAGIADHAGAVLRGRTVAGNAAAATDALRKYADCTVALGLNAPRNCYVHSTAIVGDADIDGWRGNALQRYKARLRRQCGDAATAADALRNNRVRVRAGGQNVAVQRDVHRPA